MTQRTPTTIAKVVKGALATTFGIATIGAAAVLAVPDDTEQYTAPDLAHTRAALGTIVKGLGVAALVGTAIIGANMGSFRR